MGVCSSLNQLCFLCPICDQSGTEFIPQIDPYTWTLYSSASYVPLQEVQISDPSGTDEGDLNGSHHACSVVRDDILFPHVAKVVQSLDWSVLKKMVFSEEAGKCGCLHAVEYFGTLLAIFSLAGMHREAQLIYGRIINYHKNADVGLLGLPASAVGASGGTVSLAQASMGVIRAFAAHVMLEDGVKMYILARNNGVELDTLSCDFVLKCLVERGEAEHARWLFIEMGSSGPLPNVYT